MSKSIHFLIAAACSVAALLMCAPAAYACSELPRSALNFTQQPADGASVAANARLWVPVDSSLDRDTVLTLYNNGIEVLTDATRIFADGEGFDPSLIVLTPRLPMPVGATMELRRNNATLSSFTVTATIPGGTQGPTATRIDIRGAYYGGFSCPTTATVLVGAAPADQLLLLLDRAEQYTDLPSKIRGIGVSAAFALDVDEGVQRFDIVTVDAAGLLSPRTELDELTVPSETSGCRATGRGTAPSLLVIVMIPLLFLRRRAS